MDIDGDGVVGRADLIDSLWHLGAFVSIDEFDKLFSDVQNDPTSIEKILNSNQTPSELLRLRDTQLEEYLQGTHSKWKWLTLRFLFFFFGVPILGVDYFYKIRNAVDESSRNVVKWKGGASWTAAAWLLWLPAVLLYAFYPTSVQLEDILNPALLYWTIIGVVFVAWTSASRTREGFEETYKFHYHCFAVSYTPLKTGTKTLSVPMFVEAIVSNNDRITSARFNPVNQDKRFLSYSKKRRESQIVAQWSKIEKVLRKKMDPYANKTFLSSKITMVLATVLPFIIRAVEGKPVMGDNAASIVANILLGILSCWEWWCLVEAFVRRAIKVSGCLRLGLKLMGNLTRCFLQTGCERCI